VQGQLLKTYLSVEIKTECAHCSQPLHITLDSELKYHVNNEGAEPLVFEPHVNWQEFTDPSIINAY